MSYVKKEDVIKTINDQIFMKPAAKGRLRQTINDIPAVDIVRDIFSEIESCVEYIEDQIEDKLPDCLLSVKEDIAFLKQKYIGEGGRREKT